MSVQLTTPPQPQTSARAPHSRTRTALAVAGVAGAIAAGGLAASQILLPDHTSPAQNSHYVPSQQANRELDATVAAEYRTGLTTTPRHTSVPNARVQREIRHSIANQYRSR